MLLLLLLLLHAGLAADLSNPLLADTFLRSLLSLVLLLLLLHHKVVGGQHETAATIAD